MDDLQLNKRITLKMLYYFYEVSQTHHFGQAAKNLNITNSPLSNKIKELEGLLEVELFNRDSRNVTMTTAGTILEKECEQIFKNINLSMNRVRQIGRKQKRKIKIGLVSSAFWSGFGDRLKEFHQQYSDYEIDIIEQAPNEQKKALLNGEIDLGLVRFADALSISPLKAIKITDESFIIAVPDQHRLKDRKLIDIKELRNESFSLISSENSASADFFVHTCMNEGFSPNIIKEFIEPTTLMAYLPSTQTITAVPHSFSLHKWEHIRFIRLKQSIKAGLYGIYEPTHVTPTTQEFLEYLQNI